MLIWILGTGLPQQLPESHSKLQTPGPVLQQRKKTSSRARGKFQSPALPLQWAWSRLASSRGHRNPLPSRKTQRFVFPEMSEMLQSTPPSKRKSRAQPLGPRMGFSARTPRNCLQKVRVCTGSFSERPFAAFITTWQGVWTLRPKFPNPGTEQGGQSATPAVRANQ